MILQRIDHGLQHGGAGRIQECPYRMSLLSLQTQPDAKFVVLSVSLLAWRNGVLETPLGNATWKRHTGPSERET